MALHNLTSFSDLILNLYPLPQLAAQAFFHCTLLLQASCLSPLSASTFIMSVYTTSAFTIGKQRERRGKT